MFDEILLENAEFVSEVKLAIYEASEAGDITLTEREEFLESIDAGIVPVSESFISNVGGRIKSSASKFANEVKDTTKTLNDFADKLDDVGEEIYDAMNKIANSAGKNDLINESIVRSCTNRAVSLASKAGISEKEIKSDIAKIVAAGKNKKDIPFKLVTKYNNLGNKSDSNKENSDSREKPAKKELTPKP